MHPSIVSLSQIQDLKIEWEARLAFSLLSYS